MAGQAQEMLTAAKVAAKLGVSPGAVRKVLKEAGIEADEVKSGCSYYGPATVASIRKRLAE